MVSIRTVVVVGIVVLLIAAVIISISQGSQAKNQSVTDDIEKKILERLKDIQNAAERLNPDKVYSYVLENNKGSLVQNGELFLTRKDALEKTKKGFQGIKSVNYQFDKQYVTVLSEKNALVTGEGSISFKINDGRTFNQRFAQTVIFVLEEGEWKVLHSHHSYPPGE